MALEPVSGVLPTHQALARVFNLRFGERYNVVCVGGFAQPEYLPADQTQGAAQLGYTQDYAASALHEIAHWCIAGTRRLALADFGYDYLPPPRDKRIQQRFFALEYKVQLLEAWFALGTGVRFVASADNFECTQIAYDVFAQKIADALALPSMLKIPLRAQQFTNALAAAGLGDWPAVGLGIGRSVENCLNQPHA